MSGSSPVIPSVLALLNCQKIPQVFHLILKPFDPPLVIRQNRFLDPIESVVNRVEPLHHRIKAAIHIVLLRHLAKSALDHPASVSKRIRELEGLDGEKCPKCRKMGWRIVDSRPDPTFGDLGGTRRTYKCSECEFSESKIVQ